MASSGGAAVYLGAGLAWLRLGFRTRYEVRAHARAGRAHPDGATADVAAVWAGQLLAAPWWWRMTRAVAAGTPVVLTTATVVNLWTTFGSDFGTASSVLAALAVVWPPALAWSWWQARLARRLVALSSTRLPPVTRRQRLLRAVRVPVALLLAVVVAGVLVRHAADEQANTSCPDHAVLPSVAEDWVYRGGRRVLGCPTGPSQVLADGRGHLTGFEDGRTIVSTPTGLLSHLGPEYFAPWRASGLERGALGYPVDRIRRDGVEEFIAFEHGHLLRVDGGPVRTVVGAQYEPKDRAGQGCARVDRPCLVRYGVTPEGIRLHWAYGASDSFNVGWSRLGTAVDNHVETAGYDFLLPAPVPGAYQFDIQACAKHLLTPPTCTPFTTVVIRTP
ncbi:hypothetical protein JOF53_000524 [Crossiella equi]|uniref:Uncharacterized protein n=1 Tax=Crossiella equi TaxID=130796 RepID=A0ABS5A4Z5_9PSEU|nr:hypothetical protein [Crossiella equi]MBP2471652.1 hypothetical protein [Crossiella equi]